MIAAETAQTNEGKPVAARLSSKRGFRLARPIWTVPVLVFLAVFFLVPLGANLLRSFNVLDKTATSPFFYYIKLFADSYYRGVFLETFKVSFLTTLICLFVSYPVSYFMVRHAGRWNGLIVFCLIAPLLTSIIMRTFGWNVLFARRGVFNTLLVGTLIDKPIDILNDQVMVYIGLVHVLVPFMVLSITAVLQTVDVRLEESARILGATGWQAFRRITLPLSLDGVATGCILVFVLTNGSFLTMLLLGGGKVTTLSLLIYQQFNLTQDVGFAAAMGNVLLLSALICLALQARFVRRKGIRA